MSIKFPRNLTTHNSIFPILEQTHILFNGVNKNMRGFSFDCLSVHKISMLGLLMIYKLIDFAYNNNCVYGPSLLGNVKFIKSVINHYGFYDLFTSYLYQNHSDSSYELLQFKTEGSLIIAPQPLLRRDHRHVNDMLQNKFAPQLNRFYKDNPRAIDMIFGCIGEIIGNYWQHATEDGNSLLVAEGRKDAITISCTDNGNGIISTLRKSNQFEKSTSDLNLLKNALRKGVTSKPNSNHMGYGLWLIDEITTRVNGTFLVHSEGVYYINERGRKKFIVNGTWKGSIFYLYLPLTDPVTIAQILGPELEIKKDSPKINFI